jgi:hypothetical protein
VSIDRPKPTLASAEAELSNILGPGCRQFRHRSPSSG